MLAPNTTFDLVIPWATVQPVFDKMSKRVAKRVKIDGFRKGKVPPQLAKQVIGQEQVIEHTLEEVVPPVYVSLVKEKSLHPLGNPEFHPESLEIGQDWKLHVHVAEKPEFKLGDWQKTAQQASANYRKEKAKQDKEKQAKKATSTDQPKTGDDAAKERSDRLGMIYAALVISIRPRIPELLVKQEATTQLRQLGEQLERFNLTLESFLKERQMTQEQLTNQVAAEALGRLQLTFIIDAIIREQQLQPSDKDIDQELADRPAEIREYYQTKPEAKAALENRLAQQKAEEYLLSL